MLEQAMVFINKMPFVIKTVAAVVIGAVLIVFFIGYIKSITNNRDVQLAQGNRQKSFFMGPGYKQIKLIFADTWGLLIDRTGFGISGLVHDLGDFKDDSKFKLFLLSLLYIPLVFVGIIEFILRVPLGFVALLPFTAIHLLFVLVGTLISLFLMLILRIVEKFTQK